MLRPTNGCSRRSWAEPGSGVLEAEWVRSLDVGCFAVWRAQPGWAETLRTRWCFVPHGLLAPGSVGCWAIHELGAIARVLLAMGHGRGGRPPGI